MKIEEILYFSRKKQMKRRWIEEFETYDLEKYTKEFVQNKYIGNWTMSEEDPKRPFGVNVWYAQ